MSKKKLLITFLICSLFILIFIATLYLNNRNRHDSSSYRDGRVIANIKQLQIALEQFADNNSNLFPPKDPYIDNCFHITVLHDYLVPDYMPDGLITGQVKTIRPEWYWQEFQIAISPDRKNYVIKTPLEDIRNAERNNDVDGQIMGCDCDGSNYCVVGKSGS